MERIKNLDRYQKGILLVLAAMLVIFTGAYTVVSNRVGFLYRDTILLPGEENGNTVYSGTIQGEEATFVVAPDKTVTFTYGDKIYGPYTAREDAAAVPEDRDYMTGVEILDGDEIFFRGGVFGSGEDMVLLNEDGGMDFTITAVMGDGTEIDANGNPVDKMEPSALTILQMMRGPQLTSKGEWLAWLMGLLVTAVTTVSILFADELFRLSLAFTIRNADRAEPSDWELAGRYIGWTVLTVMALAVYVMGLR